MAKKPVVLNDEYKFESKTLANDFYTEILSRLPLDTPLMGSEFDAVEALLLNHKRSDEKIGSGIKELFVGTASYGSDRCFHIRRMDESVENFGIGKCINGDSSEFAKFRQAARIAVESEIYDFKDKYFFEEQNEEFKVKCSETGQLMSKYEAHIDHRPPMTFSMICRGYLAAKKMFDKSFNISKIQYKHNETYGASFIDSTLASEFSDYHRGEALLRVITSTKNLSKAHLGRVKPTKADRSLSSL